MKTCDVCDNKHYSKGLCRRHYDRKRNSPEIPLDAPFLGEWELSYRLSKHVRQEGDCLVWVGSRDRGGYGFTSDGTKTIKAHRLSYQIHKGPIPEGLLVMHSCDNPPCVNPAHLSVGTARDNTLDAVAKGRMVGSKTGSAKLKEEDVLDIRARLAAGATCKELAAVYGVWPGAIRFIQTRHSWKHI